MYLILISSPSLTIKYMNIKRIKEIIFTTKKEKEFLKELEDLRSFRIENLFGTNFFDTDSIITKERAKLSGIIFFKRLDTIRWVAALCFFVILIILYNLIASDTSIGNVLFEVGIVTSIVSYAFFIRLCNLNNNREFFLRRKLLTKTLFEKLSNQEALADEQIEKLSTLEAKYANPSREDIIDAFPEDRDFLGKLNDHSVNLYWNHKKSRYLKNLADEKEGWQKYKLCLDKERALVMSL